MPSMCKVAWVGKHPDTRLPTAGVVLDDSHDAGHSGIVVGEWKFFNAPPEHGVLVVAGRVKVSYTAKA